MAYWIEILAFIGGLGLSAMITVVPRFGMASRQLLWFLLPATCSAFVQALGPQLFRLGPQDTLRLSFSFVILAAVGGFVCSFTIDPQDDLNSLKRKRFYGFVALAVAFVLIYLLYFAAPPDGGSLPDNYIVLGLLPGSLSGLFLLVISVVVLSTFEQVLRTVEERARWEIKFLLLGMGAPYGAVIYCSSKILLYGFGEKPLPLADHLTPFHAIFLISCCLITVSWKRSSGGARVFVSHGIVYSFITFLSVGVYLIASALLASWASQWGDLGVPTEALIFLLAGVVLAAVLLSATFRQHVRSWVRRNVFSGRYDYRQFWLEATERIRSIDAPETTAAALTDIVHRAIGAIDVSVWIRRWNPNRLHLLNLIGDVPEGLQKEYAGVIEELVSFSEPMSAANLDPHPEIQAARDFMRMTRASLIVPLISTNRIIGVIAVGSDRSGRAYDWEATEFLRVLAGHSASEFHKSELLDTLVQAKEDEAFRAFSTFVLHDLKNFASTLSLVAQNAPRFQNNPDFQSDALQSVYETAEKMKRLCNSLRAFSGTPASNKKTEDLNQIIRSVADNFNAGLSDCVKLELADIPLVLVDLEEIRRVLQNLLLNAHEAVPADGTIIVRTACHKLGVELSVEDNGKGMTRDFMEKELFIPFHTTKSGGLGIGLFQSKKIIEAHGGSIVVDSEEGKGTTVRLILPACSEAAAASQQANKVKG